MYGVIFYINIQESKNKNRAAYYPSVSDTQNNSLNFSVYK